MDYSWRGEALARLMILILILVLVVNSAVLIGFQLMTDYTYESRDEILSAYPDYNIIDSTVRADLSAYLLAAPAKENRLVLTEKHFLLNRHRLLLDEEVDRHFSAEVKSELGPASIQLDGKSKIDRFSFRSTSLPIRISSFSLRVPLGFVLWNLVLLAVELLLGFLIHKIRNG